MKHAIYKFSLFFEDFVFRIQRILKYPWKQIIDLCNSLISGENEFNPFLSYRKIHKDFRKSVFAAKICHIPLHDSFYKTNI